MKKAGTPVTRSAAYRLGQGAAKLDHEVGNKLNDYLNIGDDPVTRGDQPFRGCQAGGLGLAIMTERGMVPKEIRDLVGGVGKPGENFVKTYVSTGYLSGEPNFQREVLDDGMAD